jgi:glycosyltransferase involved in cell wall biosynthesis
VDLDLTSTVRWLGNLPIARLAEEYNRAHVFCLPSAQEGFGIAFMEAMAAGKPIVAARAAAVPEVVRNGLLVESENVEAVRFGCPFVFEPKTHLLSPHPLTAVLSVGARL